MNKNGIDDLLKVVSPGLISGYEKKNLEGKTLKTINEEYRNACLEESAFLARFLFIVFLFCVITLILWLTMTFFEVNLGDFTIISVSLTLTCSFMTGIGFIGNRMRNAQYLIADSEIILCDFKQSVEALNPFEVKFHAYTSDSVWGTLFLLVIKVFEAKLEFIKACRQENPSMSEIKTIIELEQHYRARFNSMFDASDKFGFGFSKDRLYRSAQEKIDENKAWRQ